MTGDGTSAAIVNFIANLYPLYHGERHEEGWGARSMQDGTLILPLAREDEDDDNDQVKVLWQGNPYNSSVVSGPQIATLAVIRYTELHTIGQSEEQRQAFYAHITAHFTVKTGESLCIEPEADEFDMFKFVWKATEKLGPAVLVAALKKILGM